MYECECDYKKCAFLLDFADGKSKSCLKYTARVLGTSSEGYAINDANCNAVPTRS